LKKIATVSSLKVVKFARLVTSYFLKAHIAPNVAKSFQNYFNLSHIPCEIILKEFCNMSCEIL